MPAPWCEKPLVRETAVAVKPQFQLSIERSSEEATHRQQATVAHAQRKRAVVTIDIAECDVPTSAFPDMELPSLLVDVKKEQTDVDNKDSGSCNGMLQCKFRKNRVDSGQHMKQKKKERKPMSCSDSDDNRSSANQPRRRVEHPQSEPSDRKKSKAAECFCSQRDGNAPSTAGERSCSQRIGSDCSRGDLLPSQQWIVQPVVDRMKEAVAAPQQSRPQKSPRQPQSYKFVTSNYMRCIIEAAKRKVAANRVAKHIATAPWRKNANAKRIEHHSCAQYKNSTTPLKNMQAEEEWFFFVRKVSRNECTNIL